MIAAIFFLAGEWSTDPRTLYSKKPRRVRDAQIKSTRAGIKSDGPIRGWAMQKTHTKPILS
jgi:hypothetical protein